MEGIRSRDGPFGHTVRTGDDKIVLLKVEEFDRYRKQRKIKSISLVEKREFLNEAGHDSLVFHIRDLASWKMKERIDGSIRIYLRKDLQDFFSASPPGQPVMDKSDFGTLH
jgi:hypothetical protein